MRVVRGARTRDSSARQATPCHAIGHDSAYLRHVPTAATRAGRREERGATETVVLPWYSLGGNLPRVAAEGKRGRPSKRVQDAGGGRLWRAACALAYTRRAVMEHGGGSVWCMDLWSADVGYVHCTCLCLWTVRSARFALAVGSQNRSCLTCEHEEGCARCSLAGRAHRRYGLFVHDAVA